MTRADVHMDINNSNVVGGRKCIQHICQPQGYIQCVLVRNTECEPNFVGQKNPQGTFKV